MKRLILLVLGMILVFSTVATSCHRKPEVVPAQESKLQEVKVPIWSKGDIEVEKRKGEIAFTYQNELYLHPPFYKGSMPLKYKSINRQSALSGGMTALAHDFGEFVNLFIYRDFYLAGARTYDKSGQLLAEIRVTDFDNQRMEAEEFHYGANGKLIFKCKSQFEPFPPYFKKSETETIGKKVRDYYFLLPDFLGR